MLFNVSLLSSAPQAPGACTTGTSDQLTWCAYDHPASLCQQGLDLKHSRGGAPPRDKLARPSTLEAAAPCSSTGTVFEAVCTRGCTRRLREARQRQHLVMLAASLRKCCANLALCDPQGRLQEFLA